MSKKRIKDLHPSLRPLEKLSVKGAENLSNQELLALILGSASFSFESNKSSKQK